MKQTLHSVWWKCSVLLLFASLTYTSSFSQFSDGTYWEAGVQLGPANFLGDLGGNAGKGTGFLKDHQFKTTRFLGGGFAEAYPSEWLGIRFAFNIGSIEGDDHFTKVNGGIEESRAARNLDFKSNIFEVFVAAEIYPLVFFEYEPTDVYHKIRPYFLAGVGGFHFNPKGKDPASGDWVALRPLHTEGQGFPEYPDRKQYSLWQVNVPLGVGLKYYISENTTLSFEVIHRKSFCDKIDDVHGTYIDPAAFYANLDPQTAALAERISNKSAGAYSSGGYGPGDKRGEPSNMDSYFSAGFKLGFRLFAGSDRRWRNSTRCPVIRF
jgi:Outer membrane protein beta-barrel domain